jgi:hypothetical protein
MVPVFRLPSIGVGFAEEFGDRQDTAIPRVRGGDQALFGGALTRLLGLPQHGGSNPRSRYEAGAENLAVVIIGDLELVVSMLIAEDDCRHCRLPGIGCCQ